MSQDHGQLAAALPSAGEAKCETAAVRKMLARREVRLPAHPDERGAIAVKDRMGCDDVTHRCGGRWLYIPLGDGTCAVRWAASAARQ